jgi:hypothetical protein
VKQRRRLPPPGGGHRPGKRSERKVAKTLGRGRLARHTPNTICDNDQLMRDIDAVEWFTAASRRKVR